MQETLCLASSRVLKDLSMKTVFKMVAHNEVLLLTNLRFLLLSTKLFILKNSRVLIWNAIKIFQSFCLNFRTKFDFFFFFFARNFAFGKIWGCSIDLPNLICMTFCISTNLRVITYNSFFRILVEKYPQKTFLDENLKIFIFGLNFAF